MAELLLYDEWIDFHLIGVNSSFNTSTQFIFNLNSTYDTRFQRINDLDIWLDDHTYFFETYEWIDETNKIDYHIIKNIPNQSDSKKIEVDLSNLFKESIILVPNYKDCNYIVKVSGWEDEIENLPLPFVEKDFIKLIKKIDIDLISTADRLVF
ncbi:IPExxxVDY family protein [Empedobacter falsenii]